MRIRLPRIRRCWWCYRIRIVRYTCMVGAIEVWHWVCRACNRRRPDLFEDGVLQRGWRRFLRWARRRCWMCRHVTWWPGTGLARPQVVLCRRCWRERVGIERLG